MQGNFAVINSEQSLELFIQNLRATYQNKKWLMVQVTNEKQRSQLQNNALHLWCGMVANMLNEKGLDVREVLSVSKRQEIPWTTSAVKEHLWRPVQVAHCGKSSTTKASTKDYPAIYDALNKALGQSFGISVPWPTRFQND